MNFKTSITSLLLIAIIATVTFATVLALYTLIIPTTGTVQLYELTATPASIDWGNVTLGKSVTRTVEIENTGTKNVTSLNMTYNNSSPNLLNYNLSWDCEGYDLPVGYYIVANFTLTIYEATEGTFSFDIHIGDSSP